MIFPLNDSRATERAAAGGKGATLAALRQAGYPVPDGFVISPDAFAADGLAPAAWPVVQAHLLRLRAAGANGQTAFAVRSSAVGEDAARTSFAGSFETVLDVCDDAAVRQAIDAVHRSRLAARVQAYRDAHGVTADPRMAVVVQRYVPAEQAGVLFTADPVSGSHAHMVGNVVHGSGEKLVAGEATPDAFTLALPRGWRRCRRIRR
ncbi:MAG: hypothetical protein KC425_19435 [Anaerolineales bacterium]|nr:hypothetical protein [Anaerolineales bacterium]